MRAKTYPDFDMVALIQLSFGSKTGPEIYAMVERPPNITLKRHRIYLHYRLQQLVRSGLVWRSSLVMKRGQPIRYAISADGRLLMYDNGWHRAWP